MAHQQRKVFQVEMDCFFSNIQAFLLALPIGRSSLSSTMHTSSINRTCSSSYPSSSPPARTEESWDEGRIERASEVSTSGNRVATLSAVMATVSVTVVVELIFFNFSVDELPVARSKVQRSSKEINSI